jgi:3-oxoacyl-[acyl-carrier-protein] synthase-3
MDRHDKATMCVFGDGATATLLSNSGSIHIGRGDFGTDGAKGEGALNLTGGHARHPLQSIHKDKLSFDTDDRSYSLFMNGRSVFEFVLREIPLSLERACAKNGITIEDVDIFALHQGSKYMLEHLIKRANIDPAKTIINIQKFGNTVSSSVPMVIEEVTRYETPFKGLMEISGFGVGVSWASNILRFE